MATTPPAYALTGADIADKMNAEQRSGWIFGATDMAAHLYQRLGDSDRASCLLSWSGDPANLREIEDTMRANPTLQAAAVMDVLIARHCAPKP